MNHMNLTRKELALSIAERLGIPQRSAATIVDTFFETLKNTLVQGESIKLVNFGSLNVLNKSPRRGRNPKTGQEIPITARRVVTFHASQKLKSDVELAFDGTAT